LTSSTDSPQARASGRYPEDHEHHHRDLFIAFEGATMPEPRINPVHIVALKGWLTANKDVLFAEGVNRIDAHYTDDDLSAGVISEVQAYSICDSGLTFTKVSFRLTAELGTLLESLTEGDSFFPGSQGGGGCFRLFPDSGAIQHASYEYVTTRQDHALEVY
jgi:hypothetical protein